MRAPVAILVLLALSLLAPLALASPPDPIWIHGIFDGGDGDDAIVAATGTEGTTDAALLPDASALPVVGGVSVAGATSAPHSGHPVYCGRAPPAA